MAGWPPGHCQVGADSRVILAGLRAQYTRVPREDGVRWNTSAAPPSGLPNRSCRGLRPGQPLRLQPTPSCAACPGCALPRYALLRAARVGCRGAPGARAEGCARGGRQRGALRAPEGMLPRRQGKKSTRRVFAAAPGVCPWRAVSALCRRRGQPLPQALPQLPQLRCVHLHNTRRLAASAGCARRPPLRAGERGETAVGGAGATGWVGARGGKGRSRAAVPPRRPSRAGGPAARAGGLPAPDRAGPPRVWAPPGPPWQGLRQAGSVGRVGRPQAWAPAGAGWQGVGGRGRVGLREKWLYFSYTPRPVLRRGGESNLASLSRRVCRCLK